MPFRCARLAVYTAKGKGKACLVARLSSFCHLLRDLSHLLEDERVPLFTLPSLALALASNHRAQMPSLRPDWRALRHWGSRTLNSVHDDGRAK